MPRFLFDVIEDGQASADTDGLDLPSVAAARNEALRAATDMARDKDACPKDIMIVVRKAAVGEPVATVRLSLTCDEAA